MAVVVAPVHDGMKRRIQFAVPQRIGEIVFLDEFLEALELGDVLLGRHADKPAGQGRFDQHADLIDVADEILVDRPDPRTAVLRKSDEALAPEKLERLANRVCRGAVTSCKICSDQSLARLQPSLDDVFANELINRGALARGSDGIDPRRRSDLEIVCIVHARLFSRK